MHPYNWKARFCALNRDADAKWCERTKHGAPHKPLLLLCLLERFTVEVGTDGSFTLTDPLVALFRRCWLELDMPDGSPNVALPFYHLQTDGLWTLLDGNATHVEPRGTRTLRQVRDRRILAVLPPDLNSCLSDVSFRQLSARDIVAAYFDHECCMKLQAIFSCLG
jgi:putative restriction endonuclease